MIINVIFFTIFGSIKIEPTSYKGQTGEFFMASASVMTNTGYPVPHETPTYKDNLIFVTKPYLNF